METKEIFNETGKLGNEIKRLKEQLEKINNQCLNMMELCPHEMVFEYMDNHPRLMMFDGTFFCPACGKSIRCTNQGQIKETVFKNSRIISLLNISLIGDNETLRAIREEVYNNMDLYYDKEMETGELAKRMERVLKDKEYQYQNPALVLKRSVKKEN